MSIKIKDVCCSSRLCRLETAAFPVRLKLPGREEPDIQNRGLPVRMPWGKRMAAGTMLSFRDLWIKMLNFVDFCTILKLVRVLNNRIMRMCRDDQG